MDIWRDLQDVMKIFSEGGLHVVTLITEQEGDTAASSQSSIYQGKIYDRRGIRTTIQLDSDYVTIFSPEVLTMRELWQQHSNALKAKLSVLQRVRFLARHSWLLFLFGPISAFISALMSGGVWKEPYLLATSALAAVAIVMARKQLVRLLRVLLLRPILGIARGYVQRKFQRFVSITGKG